MILARVGRTMALAGALVASTPGLAMPGGWGGGGWGSGGWGGSGWRDGPPRDAGNGADPREGKVQSERFLGDGAAARLGHGPIAVSGGPGNSGDAREAATFEAAVVDRLAKTGYETARPDNAAGGQLAEVTVVRDVVAPAEEKRSPISGEMEAGVSNRGSMMGLALAYDARKPRGALIQTRLQARILDRAGGTPLWEGRATIVTREGDPHWNDAAVAERLAGALFERFPLPTSVGQPGAD